MKINGQIINDNLIKNSKNIAKPSSTASASFHPSAHVEEKELDSHKFAVPLSRPLNAKMLKSTSVLRTKFVKPGNNPIIINEISTKIHSNGKPKI